MDTTREPSTLQCEGTQPGVTLNQGREVSLRGGRGGLGEFRGVGSGRKTGERLKVDSSGLRNGDLVVIAAESRAEACREGTRRGCCAG